MKHVEGMGKMNPFDFINAITFTKKYLFVDDILLMCTGASIITQARDPKQFLLRRCKAAIKGTVRFGKSCN